MFGCCCRCFIVVVTVWECLLCSDNLFMKISLECRTFQFSCWYSGKKLWFTCVEISLDLVQKGFCFLWIFRWLLSVMTMFRWLGDENGQSSHKRNHYLICKLSWSSASLKVKVAVQQANLIPLFCLSALCLSLQSQWHFHKLHFAVGSLKNYIEERKREIPHGTK